MVPVRRSTEDIAARVRGSHRQLLQQGIYGAPFIISDDRLEE